MRENILAATFPGILGQEKVKEQIKSALLTQRNIILVGPPGIGKTTLAREVARLLPREEGQEEDAPHIVHPKFVRIQGSPDLTAEDLIGDIDPMKALDFGPLSPEAFTPGKIFKADGGILFFDEVNRCSEKLQNTLLQALAEHRVTIGSYDVDFPANFIFIGTMNPDDSSTEPLSDVFLDRFDLIEMTYPETAALEDDIVRSQVTPVEGVTISDRLRLSVIAFIRQLRVDANLDRKPSVRASIGIIERALTTALVRGHTVATADDVAAVIASVLAHRISLKPSMKYLETPEDYVRKQLEAFARDHDLDGGDP